MEEIKQIFIKQKKRYIAIRHEDILLAECHDAGNYITIHTVTRQKYTICVQLKSFLLAVNPCPFLKRIHKSFVINTNQILFIEDDEVTLNNHPERCVVTIGPSYAQEFYSNLKIVYHSYDKIKLA